MKVTPSVQGVALVLRAYTFGVLTDMYGDIPFTEALDAASGINTPTYTPQSTNLSCVASNAG